MKCNFILRAGILGVVICAALSPAESRAGVPVLNIPDVGISTAFQRAATQNVLPAVNPNVFPGYWSVCADGIGYGYGYTYPSLDGHQMTDALLALGQITTVKQNFAYVKTFEKPNGLLPLAIFPDQKGQLIGSMGYYAQVDANGGLYTHWIPGNPLGATGSTTYIQNADAIYRYSHDSAWLTENLASVNLTADYLASLTSSGGQVAGAGYYTERPTRIAYDGVTQGYAADAFQRVAALNTVAGNQTAAQHYQALANLITANFQTNFWVGNHFAQYNSTTHGLVSNHGLTDTDWCAIATGAASPAQAATLWPQLQQATSAFYYGGMPTGIATLPNTYQDWEFSTGPSDPNEHYDLAAMGRVWSLEAAARAKMGDAAGLVNSIAQVALVGQNNGYYWRERYNAQGGYGVAKYNEYPAILISIVEHDLLGVNVGLDGSLEIAPTAPANYWTAGFGQSMGLSGGTLSYLMTSSGMSGDYSGTSAETLRVKLLQTSVRVTVNGLVVPIGLSNGEVVFNLPAASVVQPCHFVATPFTYLPGDANRDGTVNGADLDTVLSNYNGTVADDAWSVGDFDGNGTVNGADLNSVLSNYNQVGGATAAVPEPDTLALLTMGMVALLAYARRKRRRTI
jgi:hypothetical protein